MKAICPNNKDHKEFLTTAHVVQEWIVDEVGEYIECNEDCLDIMHGPDTDNVWTCKICGADAEIIK